MTSKESSVPRYTELANPLSRTLTAAAADPARVLGVLRSVDAQLFAGVDGQPALLDAALLRAQCQLAEWCAAVRADASGRVLLLGCGTSGRMAHLVGALHGARGAVAPGQYRILLAFCASESYRVDDGCALWFE